MTKPSLPGIVKDSLVSANYLKSLGDLSDQLADPKLTNQLTLDLGHIIHKYRVVEDFSSSVSLT
jgi:hypothetical protein